MVWAFGWANSGRKIFRPYYIQNSSQVTKQTDFHWGTSVAAYQIEGAYQHDGKSLSVWDVFANKKGNTYQNQHANTACDFYHRYPDDLALLHTLGIQNFRFSLAWSRILPHGKGAVNPKGIDFYNRLIDSCLEKQIVPWVTLYHWDLPHVLEQKGGWTNRDIVGWFEEYCEVCARHFGDRVPYWMIINEPMVFTGAGYFLGIHAPGKRWLKNFIPAMHHAALCQAEGGRIMKALCPQAEVGTTFSCSYVTPFTESLRDKQAAVRADALFNRLYIEPSLGMGYPLEVLPFLKRVEKYMHSGDEKRLTHSFDFIGIQNYTREVVKHSWWMPFVNADIVKAAKRGCDPTLMGWEVYPEAMYQMLKKFAAYPSVKRLIVTENGAAFPDIIEDGRVQDTKRTQYLQDHIGQVLRARQEGIPVDGYFVWTFMDNFEWAEGYRPRFGMVHVDFDTQQRTIKDSGYWYRDFVKAQQNPNLVERHPEPINTPVPMPHSQ